MEQARISPLVAKYAVPMRPLPPACNPRNAAPSAHNRPLSIGLLERQRRTSKINDVIAKAIEADCGSLDQWNQLAGRNPKWKNEGEVNCPGRQRMATKTDSTKSSPSHGAMEGTVSPRSRTKARSRRFRGRRREIASSAMWHGPMAATRPAEKSTKARCARNRLRTVKKARLERKRQANRNPARKAT